MFQPLAFGVNLELAGEDMTLVATHTHVDSFDMFVNVSFFSCLKNEYSDDDNIDIFEKVDLLGNHSLALDRKKVWYANGLEYGAFRGYVLVPSQIHIYHICQRK